VKIGRDATTRHLVFYKYVGPLYTSDEWIRVNIKSINNIRNVAQSVGARPYVSRIVQMACSEVHQTLMLEGDEACIARPMQEPTLKNSMTTKTKTHIPLETGNNVNN